MLKFRTPEGCLFHLTRCLPRTLAIRRNRRIRILIALLSNLVRIVLLLLLSHVPPCRIFRLREPHPDPFLPYIFCAACSALSLLGLFVKGSCIILA